MTRSPSQLVSRIQQADCAADLAASPPDDAGIASIINADYRTPYPLNLQKLFQWASDNAIVPILQATLADTTAFPAVCTAAGQTPATVAAECSAAITYILSGVSGGLSIDTTDPTRAAKTYQLLQLMQAVNAKNASLGLTAAQVTAFLSFGGGIVWGPNSVAASDVTNARQWLTYTAAIDAKRQSAASAYNAVVGRLDAADPRVTPSVNPATAAVPTGAQLSQAFTAAVGS